MGWRRRVVTAGGVGLGLAGLVVGAAWSMQRSLVFVPDAAPVEAPQDVREVVLTTSDELRLGAWVLRPPAEADRRTAVLYAPGNGGNRAGRLDIGRALAREGFTVLLMDYRGYGGNPGSPSEDGLARDALAAAELLTAEGFPAERTVYLGESIGTGVVARLQAQVPPAGVLLRSPFPDFAAVASHHFSLPGIGSLLRDRFEAIGHLRDSEVSTTVLHGTADDVVPSALSEEVARAVPRLHEEVVLEGVGHNDASMFGRPVVDAVVRLADHAVE